MFTKILLPLDGSPNAEIALPAAEVFRTAFDSTVTLIHVLESPAPRMAHGERHLKGAAEAESYLKEIARRFPAGARVDIHVHVEGTSNVSQSLSDHSQEMEQKLIVMCVHGHGSIPRMVAGNLAERIMGSQTVPVLLVRADAGRPFPGGVGVVLAALDGKPEHKQGLPAAIEIASRTGARLVLATAVPTLLTLMGEKGAMGRLLPGATAELLSQTEDSARRSLQAAGKRAASAGVAFDIMVARGNPARKISDLARESGADLIVLDTHGHAGTRAFWAGSTAARIIKGTGAPILLMPAGEAHA